MKYKTETAVLAACLFFTVLEVRIEQHCDCNKQIRCDYKPRQRRNTSSNQ